MAAVGGGSRCKLNIVGDGYNFTVDMARGSKETIQAVVQRTFRERYGTDPKPIRCVLNHSCDHMSIPLNTPINAIRCNSSGRVRIGVVHYRMITLHSRFLPGGSISLPAKFRMDDTSVREVASRILKREVSDVIDINNCSIGEMAFDDVVKESGRVDGRTSFTILAGKPLSDRAVVHIIHNGEQKTCRLLLKDIDRDLRGTVAKVLEIEPWLINRLSVEKRDNTFTVRVEESSDPFDDGCTVTMSSRRSDSRGSTSTDESDRGS